MRTLTGIVLLVTAMANTGCADNTIGLTKFADGQVQHIVRANDTKWRTCPPTLPANCQIAILEGHPKKPDMFTVRFHTVGEFFMPAHTHPKDERVTVIKGKAAVAFGVNASRQDATEFGPGDFYINARNAVHKVWIEKGTVIQITGIGPWEAHFVNKH